MKIKFTYLFPFLSTLAIFYSCNGGDDNNSENELPLSSSKQITGFVFNVANNIVLDENVTATINENDKTITAEVPYGTDVSSLLPTIEVSNDATASPENAQDFSSEVTYTVTAEDGSKADYIVTVTLTHNKEAQVLSFVFHAENNPALEEDITANINENTKTITAGVPIGTDVTALIPSVDVSPDTTFTPQGDKTFLQKWFIRLLPRTEQRQNIRCI